MSAYISDVWKTRVIHTALRLPSLFVIDYFFSEPVSTQWANASVYNILYVLGFLLVCKLWHLLVCATNEVVIFITRRMLCIAISYISYCINRYSPTDDASTIILTKNADDYDLNVSYNYWLLLYDNIFHILIQLGLALVYDRLDSINSISFWKRVFGTTEFRNNLIIFLLPVIYKWFWSSNFVLFLLVFSDTMKQFVSGVWNSIRQTDQNSGNQSTTSLNGGTQGAAVLNKENQDPVAQHQENQGASAQNGENIQPYSRQAININDILLAFWIGLNQGAAAQNGENVQPYAPQAININDILLAFWIGRVSAHTLYSIFQSTTALHYIFRIHSMQTINIVETANDPLFNIVIENIFQFFVIGSGTILALIAMRSVVQIVSKNITHLVIYAAGNVSNVAIKINFRASTANFFFSWALIVDLLTIENNERINQLHFLFCTSSIVLMNDIHDILDRYFLERRAFRNITLRGLCRLVGVCFALNVSAAYIVRNAGFEPSSWLFILLILFTIKLVIKTIVMLLLRTLDWIQFHYDNIWMELDTHVYLNHQFTTQIELFFGVIAFCCNAWCFVFKYCNPVLAFHLCASASLIFIKFLAHQLMYVIRQKCISVIQKMPEATAIEQQQFKDICSICQSDLDTARVLPCSHVVHEACLVELIMYQDTCPRCPAKMVVCRNPVENELSAEIEGMIRKFFNLPDSPQAQVQQKE